MSDKLHLYICEYFKAETLAVISEGNFNDVTTSYFPSRCGLPLLANKQLSSLPMFNKDQDGNNLLCGCSCISTADKTFLVNHNIKQLYLVNCFQMFAPNALIKKILNEGAYIMTPDWLKNWRVCVKEWGGKEQVRQMFSESITKVVLLDTGIFANSKIYLEDFSEYIDRPSETILIGLDYYRIYLENVILKWRLEKKNTVVENFEGKSKNNESDYAMALDLLGHLPRTEKEETLAFRIMEIFVMMFSAQKVSYLSITDDKQFNLWSIPPNNENNDTIERLSKHTKALSMTESGNGFCMNIEASNQILAVIEADGIVFKENLSKYQNLALAMTQVFAISIENSRYFQHILKMNFTLETLNATKDKFFSIIAHDLMNPLGQFKQMSYLLREEYDDYTDDERKDVLELMKDSSNNIYSLLENLLEWSMSQSGKIQFNPVVFNLRLTTTEIIKLMKPIAYKKEIDIIHHIPFPIEITGDANMINTVIRNLISNAIKFTPVGGVIEIGALNKPSEGSIHIYVKDSGVGMSPEILNKLFRIDQSITSRGTNNEKGTGLGLILCKEFVEKHGGRIWVESELGNGSTFYFALPLDPKFGNKNIEHSSV